jgi:hypothetical protein
MTDESGSPPVGLAEAGASLGKGEGCALASTYA